MPKKKIPGQIRFTPELDCISLERVRQDFWFPSGHKFSQHHRTAGFFQTGYGGPVKVYWFGSCTKKMGQVEQDRCTGGRHLYFSSSDFVFSCPDESLRQLYTYPCHSLHTRRFYFLTYKHPQRVILEPCDL